MTQILNCTHTAAFICNGNIPNYMEPRIKYECSVELFSSVKLQSCGMGNQNDYIYWFWYDDVCRSNTLRSPTTLVTTTTTTFSTTIFSTTERITA
ncbi:unnamed protein product, partial [Rotaria sp. Silwood2]